MVSQSDSNGVTLQSNNYGVEQRAKSKDQKAERGESVRHELEGCRKHRLPQLGDHPAVESAQPRYLPHLKKTVHGVTVAFLNAKNREMDMKKAAETNYEGERKWEAGVGGG
jgi:hypothetical protein